MLALGDTLNAGRVFLVSTTQRPDLLLAALTGLDPRTVRKAIDHGLEAIKGRDRRERLSACAAEAGVTLRRAESTPPNPPPPSRAA